MNKTIAIALMIVMFLTPTVIVAQDPTPASTPEVGCDVSLAKCRTDLAAANTELVAFHSAVPGKGFIWKVTHWSELSGSQKTALIIEIGTAFIALSATAYTQIEDAR